MTPALFSVSCTTCGARLQVYDATLIGQIVACPKCGGMVQVLPPEGWSDNAMARQDGETSAVKGSPAATPPEPPRTEETPPGELDAEANADEAIPSVEARLRRATWVAGAVLVVLAVTLVAVLLNLPARRKQPSPGQGGRPPGSNPVDEADVNQFLRRLPEDTRLAWTSPPAYLPAIGTVASLETLGVLPVMRAFGLQPRVIERISYVTTDLAEPSDHAVLVIRLIEGQNTAAFDRLGEAVSVEVEGTACRRLPRGPWPHLFAVPDRRTLIAGSESALRAFFAATPPDPEPRGNVVAAFLRGDKAELLIGLSIDLEAARRAEWTMTPSWLHVWPAASSDWETAMADTLAVGVAVRRTSGPPPADGLAMADTEEGEDATSDRLPEDTPDATPIPDRDDTPRHALRLDVRVYCADEASAAHVAERWQTLTAQAQTWLAQIATAAEALESDAAIPPESVETLRAWVADLRPRVDAMAWETDGSWIGCEMSLDEEVVARVERPADVAAAAVVLWLAALDTVEQRRLERVGQALAAYREAHGGAFPTAVLGEGGLLDSDTRLSWIAALLPWLDQEDWAGELAEGVSWNGAGNAAVARRPLRAVRNPARASSETPDGFAVTHYAGVAGLGPDAATLPLDHPRAGVFGNRRVVRLDDITDGVSNTIAVMPVERDLGPWAAGGRATVRPLTEAPYVRGPDGFGAGQPDGMPVLMADGSVRFLSKEVAREVVESLATIRGGEKLPDEPWWNRPSRAATRPPAPGPADLPPPAREEPVVSEPTVVERPVAEPRPPVEPWTEAELKERFELSLGPIDLAQTPWREAMQSLAGMAGASISFDLDALQKLRIDVDSPLRLQIPEASLGEAIDRLTLPAGLICSLRNGQLYVTAEETGEPSTVEYPVADLASDAETLRRLAEWIERFVAPETWSSAGGAGRLDLRAGVLTANQTAAVHHQIVVFLERLRLARRLQTQTPWGPQLSSVAPVIDAKAKLATPVSLNYHHPGDLAVVLADMERRSGVRIVADWSSLVQNRVVPTTACEVTVVAQPLKQALVELLEPLDATYRVVDARTVEILTRHDASERYEVAFFPLGEMIAQGAAWERLLERLRTEVAPETWQPTGGPGVLWYDEASRTVVVLQSQPVIVAIDQLLSEMRDRMQSP